MQKERVEDNLPVAIGAGTSSVNIRGGLDHVGATFSGTFSFNGQFSSIDALKEASEGFAALEIAIIDISWTPDRSGQEMAIGLGTETISSSNVHALKQNATFVSNTYNVGSPRTWTFEIGDGMSRQVWPVDSKGLAPNFFISSTGGKGAVHFYYKVKGPRNLVTSFRIEED